MTERKLYFCDTIFFTERVFYLINYMYIRKQLNPFKTIPAPMAPKAASVPEETRIINKLKPFIIKKKTGYL